jgi:hypothetical protein
VRDQKSAFRQVDLTEIDEPERPIFARFSTIEERDLVPLTPEEFSQQDFVEFFQNPSASWRPYAAGLPWVIRAAVPRRSHRRTTFCWNDASIASVTASSA